MKHLNTPISMGVKYLSFGHVVNLLTLDGPGPYPVIGIVDDSSRDGTLRRWTRRGRSINVSDDLVLANPRPIDIAREVARGFYHDHADDTETSYETCALRIVAGLEQAGFIKV